MPALSQTGSSLSGRDRRIDHLGMSEYLRFLIADVTISASTHESGVALLRTSWCSYDLDVVAVLMVDHSPLVGKCANRQYIGQYHRYHKNQTQDTPKSTVHINNPFPMIFGLSDPDCRISF